VFILEKDFISVFFYDIIIAQLNKKENQIYMLTIGNNFYFIKEFAVGEDYNKITLLKQYLGILNTFVDLNM